MKQSLNLFLLILLAAASLEAKSPSRVEDDVHERAGAEVKWQRDTAAREDAAAIVRKLLAKPLTVSSAVQIALLSNRTLQATFEEIESPRPMCSRP